LVFLACDSEQVVKVVSALTFFVAWVLGSFLKWPETSPCHLLLVDQPELPAYERIA
jgi:hypothetical protein